MEETKGNGGGAGRARPQRILIVEPDHQRRIHAAQSAAALGFRVLLAPESPEAALLIAREAGQLDAVIVNLANADEIEAVSADHPDLKVIRWGNEDYSIESLGALLGPARPQR